jgi:hypothetical protein
MKGCEVLCVTEDDEPKMAKLWYSMSAKSSIHIEDSKIVGKLAHNASNVRGSFTIGKGVEIATDTLSYFSKSNVVYAEGVTAFVNSDALECDVTVDFIRSGLTADYALYNSENYTIADSCFTDSVKISRSFTLSVVTFVDEELPEYLASVEWYDNNGVVLVDQFYALVGTPLTVPATLQELGCYDVEHEWYTRTYEWQNFDGTPVGETVTQGVNVYSPSVTEWAHIDGIKANVTLSSDMIFNLYLPIPDKGIKDKSIYSPQAIGKNAAEVTVNGFRMLKLSFLYDVALFEGKDIEIAFTPRVGNELRFTVNIDLLKYASTVVQENGCGSGAARLMKDMTDFKRTMAAILGKTPSEAAETALGEFDALFASHGAECGCSDGFTPPVMQQRALSVYTDAGVSGIQYKIENDKATVRINVTSGATVKSASYLSRGKEVKLSGITHEDGCYLVEGLPLSDALATLTLTVNYGGVDRNIEHSLAQYIITASGDEVAVETREAFLSYAYALASYK